MQDEAIPQIDPEIQSCGLENNYPYNKRIGHYGILLAILCIVIGFYTVSIKLLLIV
jgi:hypothetical protein